MRKRSDSSPPKEVTRIPPATIIKQERAYQLITPLYGGGVSPTKPDPITVVRATEIRGHLRFWWRAYHAGQFSGLTSLKKAEDKLWGAAAKKENKRKDEQNNEKHDSDQNKKEEPQPTVQLEVKIGEPGTDIDAYSVIETTNKKGEIKYQVEDKWPVPLYAVFPLQPQQKELNAWNPATDKAKQVRDGVLFTLTIYFPEEKKDEVEAALWAWETFGGIGARTRRGFGALRLLSIDGNDNTDLPDLNMQTPKAWIEGKLKKPVVSGTYPLGMPRLTSSMQFITTNPSGDEKAIWNKLINKLKSFRQNRQRPNNPKHPGRSIWPEPSEIRRFTNQSLPAHENPPIPEPPIHKFSRAVFGLPIIFQFKDRDKSNYPDNPYSDPQNTVLRLDISERLASPLILKPLACQNGKYLGLAVILDGVGVDEDRLILKKQKVKGKGKHVKYTFDSTESLVVGKDRSGNPISIDSSTNALQAFLKYLEGI
jgi:CRISPR-associated protein Cmr1